MKVYLVPEGWMSIGIQRVARALARYRPDWVDLVATPEEADLQIVHMVGDGQRKHWLTGVAPRPFAAIQYCLRTTEFPNTKDWVDVWAEAKAVWSYYDLDEKMFEDGVLRVSINHYHAPLGVDADVFKPSVPLRKTFVIGTSGYIAETEGVRESYIAARQYSRQMFHLGPNLDLGPGVLYASGVSDADVADFWSRCSFVAGLRRIEGFELPAIEGLMCGARPIMFDAPHYRHWFGEHAEYVTEGSVESVTAQLIAIMGKPVRAVTAFERTACKLRFDWVSLCLGFWEALR